MSRIRAQLAHILVLFGVMFVAATQANAATAASGDAHGLSTALSLKPLVGASIALNLGPLPSVSGSAGANYNTSDTVASATGNLGALGTLVTTGVLRSAVDATLASDVSHASAGVDSLHVGITGLLSLDASAVTATATASCVSGSVAVSGTTAIAGGALKLLGIPVPFSASPAPNTGLSALGITVLLNEQIVSGNSITVNAVHVKISNALLSLLGAIGGDIIVGHATTSLTSTCPVAPPPPATKPDLSVTISQPSPSFIPNVLSMVNVKIENVGNATAVAPLTLWVTVPAEMGVPASFTTTGGSCTTTASVVKCVSLASMAPGASVMFEIPVTPGVAAAGKMLNFSASADSVGGETVTANNSHSMSAATAPVTTPTPVPDLAVVVGNPAPALKANAISTIPVTVTNIGGANAPGPMTVAFTLPAGFTYVGATSTWACSLAAPVVTCTRNISLAPTASTFVNIDVTYVTAADPSVFKGEAAPVPGETSLGNNSATMSATLGATISSVDTFDPEFDYQDLWWNSSESGWGVGVFHQGDTIFITMFVYKEGTTPHWFVASGMTPAGVDTWSGGFYQTTGPAFNQSTFLAGQVTATPVGEAKLVFHDHSNATLTYSVNGVTFTKEIIRETFRALTTLAGNYTAVTKTETSGCTDAALNGTKVTTGIVTITVDASNFMTMTGGSAIGEGGCTTAGPLAQSGTLYVHKDSTTTCSTSRQSRGTSLFKVTPHTFVQQRDVATVGETCVARITSAGVK